MTIGIGGAGCKLAVELDNEAILVNVSQVELNKVEGGSDRILATVRAEQGQFRGSRKNPEIGHDAYESIKRELQVKIRGNKVFSSTGGGTGNGISMTANKHQGVRCALCWDVEIAALARQHNDANICGMPARFISKELAVEIAETFLKTEFEGGRHERRIKKIPLK